MGRNTWADQDTEGAEKGARVARWLEGGPRARKYSFQKGRPIHSCSPRHPTPTSDMGLGGDLLEAIGDSCAHLPACLGVETRRHVLVFLLGPHMRAPSPWS